jgi:hypothetical protein
MNTQPKKKNIPNPKRVAEIQAAKDAARSQSKHNDLSPGLPGPATRAGIL